MVLNQLHRRDQRVAIQYSALATFLETTGLTRERKYNHGRAALALILFVRSVREHSA